MGWLQTKHPNYFVLTLSYPQHLMSQVGLRLTRFVLDVALIQGDYLIADILKVLL